MGRVERSNARRVPPGSLEMIQALTITMPHDEWMNTRAICELLVENIDRLTHLGLTAAIDTTSVSASLRRMVKRGIAAKCPDPKNQRRCLWNRNPQARWPVGSTCPYCGHVPNPDEVHDCEAAA